MPGQPVTLCFRDFQNLGRFQGRDTEHFSHCVLPFSTNRASISRSSGRNRNSPAVAANRRRGNSFLRQTSAVRMVTEISEVNNYPLTSHSSFRAVWALPVSSRRGTLLQRG
jgi:hypothetical protein